MKFLAIFLVCLFVIEIESHSDRMCGAKLSQMMWLVCENGFNTMMKKRSGKYRILKRRFQPLVILVLKFQVPQLLICPLLTMVYILLMVQRHYRIFSNSSQKIYWQKHDDFVCMVALWKNAVKSLVRFKSFLHIVCLKGLTTANGF